MRTTRGDFRFRLKTKKVLQETGEGIKRENQCPSWSFVFGLWPDLCRSVEGAGGVSG
jgi:hypothetical protein